MVKADQDKNTEKLALDMRVAAGVTRLVFMTDAPDLGRALSVISRLPQGSLVIFRAYNAPNREDCAKTLFTHARTHKQTFLLAADVQMARRIGADGVHLPEHMLYGVRPNLFGFHFVTAACHTRSALRRAARLGADMALVSPVFSTRSHPDAKPLGVHRFSRLIAETEIPVAALGGINAHTAKQMRGLGLEAVAGMSAIV